jgi:hypothetical protein
MPSPRRPSKTRVSPFSSRSEYLSALVDEVTRARHTMDAEGAAWKKPKPRARFQGRVRATEALGARFDWPDEALATAASIPRPLAATLVMLHALDLSDAVADEVPPEPTADLVLALMRVAEAQRAEVTAALRPGGRLETLGLLGHPELGDPWDERQPSSTRLLPAAVRRFIDGLPTPMQGTRLVEPGRIEPARWLGADCVAALAEICTRRIDLEARLASSDLPTAAALERLGSIRLALPSGVPGADLAGALASLLDRPLIDARHKEGAPHATSTELVAEARLRGGVILQDGYLPATGDQDLPPAPFGHPDMPPGEELHGGPGVLVLKLCRTGGSGPPPAGVVLLDPPDPEERRALWSQASSLVWGAPLPDAALDRLAIDALHPEEILAAVSVAAAAKSGGPPPVEELARLGRRPEGDATVKRVEVIPTTRLADVVLTPPLREQAEHALAACKDGDEFLATLRGTVHDSYGHSPVLLFSGAPGTGKTWLARALAGELQRTLRCLSGPDLRSCWYGHAEKKIRAEFRRPDDAVLLLDEVDGFLKKRGGPSAQHDDRLANVLLEELEQTRHLVILATNLPDGLDPAVARRVLFHLRFDEPGRAERATLWRLHLPAGVAGAGDVDCDRLAALPLNGGSIKNATFRAILRARREGVPLDTDMVEAEGRREAGTRGARSIGFGAEG